jgi:uncharacterized protein YndB with AHSA1/START domain
MKKIQFSVNIRAPREKVWETLWNDATYRQWTSVFSEGSYAVSDWQEGSSIEFLSPGGSGMYSEIARLVPNEHMSFRHLGEIKNGVREPRSDWAGAVESYTLRSNNGSTDVIVDLDATGEFEDYFRNTFPKALEKLKDITEKQNIQPVNE